MATGCREQIDFSCCSSFVVERRFMASLMVAGCEACGEMVKDDSDVVRLRRWCSRIKHNQSDLFRRYVAGSLDCSFLLFWTRLAELSQRSLIAASESLLPFHLSNSIKLESPSKKKGNV